MRTAKHAIGIIIKVSIIAVAVGTCALICVLSVMNGFEELLRQQFAKLDPPFLIKTPTGAVFSKKDPCFDDLNGCGCLIREALLEYKGKQVPVRVKGCDTNYTTVVPIDSVIVDGRFQLTAGSTQYCVMGRVLANRLGVGAHFIEPLHLYAPTTLNSLHPERDFQRTTVFMKGIFSIDQPEYDEMLFVSLDVLQRLFGLPSDAVTQMEIGFTTGEPLQEGRICRGSPVVNPDEYVVLNRAQQQGAFFRIVQAEKLITATLLLFIILIASFGIIAALTMLRLEKTPDMCVLRALGLKDPRPIFRTIGILISTIGTGTGVSLGIIICLIQQHFGFLKLAGDFNYVVQAYPVVVQGGDIFCTLIGGILIGILCTCIASK